MFLCRWSVSRPIAMTSFIIVLVMLGVNSYRKLSIDLMPSVDSPFLSIRAEYDGGSPEEIEVEVARRIEDAVASQEGVKHISAMCMENVCNVSMEFNMGANIDIAATDVREKLNRIRDNFPDGVEEPVIRKIDNTATTVVNLFLVGDRPIGEIYDYADHVLADRFSSVNGVGEVRVYGSNEMQMHILVDRAKLTATNLTMSDLVAKLKANNVRTPAGRIRGQGREINITFDGEFKSIDDIKSLEIGQHEGRRVYVRDVADVKLISREVRGRSFVNGQPSARLNIVKRSDANVMQVIAGIRKRVDEINREGLPGGMELIWFKDAGTYIQAAVDDAWNSILLGVAITAGLLFLFLHDLRSTFIVMITMPVSVVVTFSIMQAFDYTFNTMTLLSLGCSVGVLVTNSIVVIENIFRHLDRGEDTRKASGEGSSEVAVAVAASALTNVVVFVPVAMMTTRTGRMLAPFAAVMVAATLVSLFISFTLTPIMALVLLKQRKQQEGSKQSLMQRLFIPWDRGYDWLEKQFIRSIRWTRRHALLVVIVTAVAAAAARIFIIPQVGMSFLPKTDQGQVTVRMEFPANYNLESTIEQAKMAAQTISKLDFVRGVDIGVGNVSGAGGQVSSGVYLAQLLVKVTAKDERDEHLEVILERVRKSLASFRDCIVTLTIPSAGGGAGSDISMRVSGSDIAELESLGNKIMEKVRVLRITEDLDSSVRTGKPNISLTPRRPILQNLGISAETLSDSVRGTYEGIEVGTYRMGNRSFDIRIKQNEEDGLDQLKHLAVGSKDGNPLNINVLTEIKEDARSVSISRYDRDRTIWIYANLAPGQSLGGVAAAMRKAAQEVLPQGYRIRFSGQVERMGETSSEFVEVIVLAVALTYLLIVALLESWSRPFLILFTVPLGFIGMYLTLFISGVSMSMMGLLGGVMMIGIVVNNAILIMDETARLNGEGMLPHDAMEKASGDKFRPIVMTTLASVAGMLPMAFGTGVGSELRSSCGLGVVGGLIFAGVTTLYVIPALYFLFVRNRNRDGAVK